MRIGNIQPGRPEDYDRNPLNVTQRFGSNVGPHATTQRWAYTVPTNRKARISSAMVELFRNGASGANNSFAGYIAVTPFGGSAAAIVSITAQDNTVGFTNRWALGFVGYVFAGDMVDANDFDNGTGGSLIIFAETAVMNEFDA